MSNPESIKSNALDTVFQPPPLPGKNQTLDVYADYVASLESFEERVRGYVGWLKGHALLRAKSASSAGYCAIINAFGWPKSTGYVYKSIAQEFKESEVRGKSVTELRDRITRMNAEAKEANAGNTTATSGDPRPERRQNLYSIKQAFKDLKAAKKLFEKVRDRIGETKEAINEPHRTPMALKSMEIQFDELSQLLKEADQSRCRAMLACSEKTAEMVTQGVMQRLESVREEAA
jgi:hypothetical protein